MAPAEPPPGRLGLGMNFSPLMLDRGIPEAVVNRQLADAAGDGVRIARTDALWEATELYPPSNGVHAYDWRFDDRSAADLARRGIRWWAILDYAPAWASGVAEPRAPPRGSADYAAYARAFLARYGVGGEFWREHPELPALPVRDVEIWNEPDSPIFWMPHPDPVRYAALYAAARAALHAVDPRVRVWTGGLAHGVDWLAEMLAAHPGPVDGIALHAYSTDPADLIARLAAAERAAATLPGVPFALTEFGWRTDKPDARDYAPEAERAQLVGLTLRRLAEWGCVRWAFGFAWTSPAENYGITPRDGGSTPTRRAWASALADPPVRSSPSICPR